MRVVADTNIVVSGYVAPRGIVAQIEDDPDDNKFLECAVAGGAEYVVSGDPHLLALRQFRGIQILSPAAFLTLLNAYNP